ncbi:MAG: hypothetical protein ACRDTA_13390 [Pseudonocardiaceae bacterium]
MVVGIDAVLAPTLTPWLVHRFGGHRVVVAGLALAAAAYALFLPVGPDWTYATMFSSLLVLGFAFALTYGLAVVTAVVVATTGADGSPQAQLDEFRAALMVPLIVAILGVIVTATGLGWRSRSADSAGSGNTAHTPGPPNPPLADH